MNTINRNVWNLNSLVLSNKNAYHLKIYIDDIEDRIKNFKCAIDDLVTSQISTTSKKIADIIEQINFIQLNISEANSYSVCLLTLDLNNGEGNLLQNKIKAIEADFKSSIHKMQRKISTIEDTVWEKLIHSDLLKEYAFSLNEWRNKVNLKLPEEEEGLASTLMSDGYHAWGQYYTLLISKLKINISINGDSQSLSIGQALNLRTHPNKEVRKNVHDALERVCTQNEDLFAKILNHIVGFRIQMYNMKGIENILKEPLEDNRIKKESLDAMWRSIDKYKIHFTKYLDKKAEILGEPKLNAYNFWAPLSEDEKTITYSEAVDFILNCFGKFGEELYTFTQHAFENGWVESENGPKKSTVAYCAGFPLTKESRISLAFDGTMKSVLTLVHELGHAFHNHAVKDLEPVNQKYPLSLAETASIFSEFILLDTSLENAQSDQERLLFLDEKLKRSTMNFMEIHTRFLFEKTFTEERTKGIVSLPRINDLMKEAMIDGYKEALTSMPIHSWVWTPHYYITQSPFYNFPYTFGYLFSLSIYAKAKESGKEFESKYLSLLRDSGCMTVEDLVMKHLHEDITTEEFWEKGLTLCLKDVEEFICLAGKENG